MQKTIGLVAAVVAVGVLAGGASAVVLSWDFSVHPTQEAVPMNEYIGDTGDPNRYTASGGYGSGAGLLGDGTAEFADTASLDVNGSGKSLAGNYGFVIGGDTGAFTFDMRVKVIESVTGDARGKSVSFRDSTGRGRGLALNLDNIQLKDGSGAVRTYGPIDLTQWQIIRNVLTGVDTGGGVYVVSTYLWATDHWIHLGDQGLGGSGYASEIAPGGIALGSMAGGSTNAGKFHIDWARVDTENALGPEAPPLVPEPATLALLTLGAIPMLRRRR